MKTIEVTDEMYESLMELSNEMLSQDPRGTKMPHMFQVRTTEQVAAYPGQGDEIWVNGDGEELKSEQEMRDYIKRSIYENDQSIKHLTDDEAESFANDKVEGMSYFDLVDCLTTDANGCMFWGVRVQASHKYENTFFTAKACNEHIEANKHRYTDPVCYLNHAFRNPEMELVSKFLCELSGGKIHK